MSKKDLYYIYARESDDNGEPLYHVIHIVTENGRWQSHELFDAPMTCEQMTGRGIVPVCAPEAVNDTLPRIYTDKRGIKRLKAELFKVMYHKFNPKEMYPFKPGLFRTVTLLGVTCREEPKYVKYHMTNREIPLLDEHHKVYGYYVCDYNGAVAYLTTEQMLSIMNRYGTTDAKINNDGIVMNDGSTLPVFTAPKDAGETAGEVFDGLRKKDTAKYLDSDDDTEKFEIKKLRYYADTFFTLRRCSFPVENSSSDGEKERVIDEFMRSVEAYHQALIRGTVSRAEYERISSELDKISERLENDETEYRLAEKRLMSQLRNVTFTYTSAFGDMLSNSPRKISRLVNLQTLCDLSSDIVTRYSQILLAEQSVTAALVSMEGKYGFELEGLKFRMKSPNSLYEKIYERSDHPDQTPEQLFGGAKDILRYTAVFNNEDDYTVNIPRILGELIREIFKGAALDKFRNFWTPYVSGDYKGVNTVIKLPDMCFDTREGKLVSAEMSGSRYCVDIPSFCFEFQFHTKDGLRYKEINHGLYEINRNVESTEEQRKANNITMKENMAKVKTPKNAEFLNEISTEYITALKKSIKLMEKELSEIGKTDGLFDPGEL